MYTMMLNINPAELDSDLFFRLVGRPYGHTPPWGEPDSTCPNALERRQLVQGNAVGAAHFAYHSMAAMLETMLGWPVGADRQRNQHAPFGKVLAFFGKPEATARGSMHFHFMVNLANLQPQRLQRLLQQNMTAVLAHMESLQCQYLPGGYKVPLNTDGDVRPIFPAGSQLPVGEQCELHHSEAPSSRLAMV